jgi:cytochrome c peroxidase
MQAAPTTFLQYEGKYRFASALDLSQGKNVTAVDTGYYGLATTVNLKGNLVRVSRQQTSRLLNQGSSQGPQVDHVWSRNQVPTNLQQEWRTPPLWGVRDSAPYLHDGRAGTLVEAIAWHGGQGTPSANAFLNLETEKRLEVLEFLRTLRAPDVPN